MGISKLICAGGLALALAACGGEKKDEATATAAAAAPAKLAGGLYEVSAEVTQLASTDNSTPAVFKHDPSYLYVVVPLVGAAGATTS